MSVTGWSLLPRVLADQCDLIRRAMPAPKRAAIRCWQCLPTLRLPLFALRSVVDACHFASDGPIQVRWGFREHHVLLAAKNQSYRRAAIGQQKAQKAELIKADTFRLLETLRNPLAKIFRRRESNYLFGRERILDGLAQSEVSVLL